MTDRKRARLFMVLLLVCGIATATSLVLTALGKNVSYFRTPSDIMSGQFPEKNNGHRLRLGGLVEKGTLVHDGSTISFRVTDLKKDIEVHYQGVVPDLFREGQGIIAEGRMNGTADFDATILLAKHDEKYMPPEVAKELKQSGQTP